MVFLKKVGAHIRGSVTLIGFEFVLVFLLVRSDVGLLRGLSQHGGSLVIGFEISGKLKVFLEELLGY